MDHLVVVIVGALVVAVLRWLDRRKDKRPPVRSTNPHHPDHVRAGDVAWSMLIDPIEKLTASVDRLAESSKRIESKVDRINAWRKP